MALWGMAEDPADRLCPDHRMLPVLIGPGIGFDPLREANRLRDTIRGHLQRLVEATDPIPDDLFDKLLRQKRLLVVLDGLSEIVQEPESDASKEARPRHPSFAVAALIITSRQHDKALEPLDTVIEPIRLDTDHLLPFLNAYLAAAGRASLTDAELYRACSRLAEMVGTERGITPLLARLYAEQLIDVAQTDATVRELPETTPELMLRYLNSLNRDRQGSNPDNPTVHRVAKVVAWCCLKSAYRPGTASKKELRDELAKLNTSHSSDDLLSYLEHRLRVIRTIEPAETHVQFVLDPLAEYLAGMFVVEENRGNKQKWERFFQKADKMLGAPQTIRGFLLAMRDCCLASNAEIPSFVVEELGGRGGLDPELVRRLQLEQRVRYLTSNLRLPYADDRRAAANALASIGPKAESSIGALISAFRDDDEEVRGSAAEALIKIGPASVPALIDKLNDERHYVRFRAAYVLGMFGHNAESAISTLIKLLQDEHPAVRRRAAETLGLIGPGSQDAIPSLSRMLQDEDNDARRFAAQALSRIRSDAREVSECQ